MASAVAVQEEPPARLAFRVLIPLRGSGLPMPRKAVTAKAAIDAPSGGSSKTRRRDPEVLAAAADIFHERGYARATVQDVADALGMLKGSLYYYIDSKEDLLYRLVDEIHNGVDQLLSDVEEVPGLSAVERLELYVKRTVEYNARNLKQISVYYHDIDQLVGDRRKEILARRRAHEERITKLIREAQSDGDASSDLDAKLLSNCLFAIVIWMYRWYRPGRRVSIDEVSETCAHFVRYGLSPAPSLARPSGRGKK
jgi:AcrR family transcriptional regulator